MQKHRLQGLSLIIIFLILFIAVSVSLILHQPELELAEKHPEAIHGILDTSEWDPDTMGMIDLSGEWEFYWRDFISPIPESDQQAAKSNPIILKQPGLWNQADIPGSYFPPDGFASLRLVIKIGEKWPQKVAFYILEPANSYRMYINGQLAASSGQPGMDQASTLHSLRPRTAEFIRGEQEELEIVLHIANYIDREGGRKRPIYLGTTNTIKKMRNRRIVSEGLIGGALLIIGLYNLVLFLVRRSERLPLAFSAVCFVFGIYALFSGERLILLFFDIPFELFGKLWFFQYYIMVPAVAWFIHCLFPEDGRLPVYKGLAIFSAILAGLTFALPFSRGVDIFSVNHIATAATAVYLIVKIILALRRKREHALSFALAAAIFILATVNDILYSENLISTLRISSYGLLGFALAVSVMVSRRFASAYMQEEQSATSLRRYSRSLEELVGERTAELETQTNKLEDGIRYAKLIQDSVLPSMDSLKIILPECELFFRPRHIVGGDFYWAQAIEPGRGWLALGDCPGTGVTGALRVMRTISLLNNAITHENPAMKGINDPASIMSWLHGRRLEESSHNSSMDLLLIYWDNGDVKYASSRLGFFVRTKAGQDGIPPVHFFPGDKKSLGSPRTPGNHAFRQGNISLEAGDYMYLLTDGLLQQNGEDKPFPFGKRRMADLIQSIEGEGPKDHLFAISNGLNEYQQNMTQHDDNLLIIIRNI